LPCCRLAWYLPPAVLRFLSALLAVTVVAFLGLGFILPSTWEAKRTATFETTPDRVADLVGALDTWPDWSHFSAHVDEETKVTVEGATLTWGGGEVLGAGTLANFATANDCATYDLSSGDARSAGKLCWELVPSDDPEIGPKTRVTWSETGESDGGPLVRWFGFLSVDAALGSRFVEALGRLEELAEAEPAADAEPDPEPTPQTAADDDDSAAGTSADDDDSATGPDSAGDDDSAR
jgi:hypothetical protein